MGNLHPVDYPQVEFWQNLEKKRITYHDFPPPNIFVGSENKQRKKAIPSVE